MEIHCLECGAALTLQSSATVFIVCSYCKSTMVRDQDWTHFGRMADLPPEVTPLQVGVKGLYQGESFELIGRLRLHWQDGNWNEWCALFSKNRIGWLAEAQGFYMLSFALDEKLQLPDPSNLRPGDTVDLGRKGLFVVDDCKVTRCVGSEGELPFPAPAMLEFLSIDCSDSKGQFLSIEKMNEELRVSTGRYLEFKDFQFKHLRQLDGW